MENPHEEKQAVYLERIIKNADKCLEALRELNACIQAIRASSKDVDIAADLFDNYRRNVEWNLKQNPMPGPVLLDVEPPEEGEASSSVKDNDH
ncbi:hypothetical protein FRB99_006877 [Tulasnella sp. 403]|nr:hypothetical protein FRB99_006877 [Tulasnella sp. 403]